MSTEATPHLPVNHVFVDVENVKRIEASVLGGKHLRLHLFLGPQNKKLDVEVVEKLLEHAQAVQLIRSGTVGRNALDFVLAYHLGQAVLADPKGYFHIVSKDAGFDALVDLLKSRHVKVKRHEDWAALNFLSQPKPSPVVPAAPAPAPAAKAQAKVNTQAVPKPAPANTLSAAAEKLVGNLKKTPKNRPKKEKTLIAHATNITGKDKPDAETRALRVLEELKKAKLIAVDANGAVSYHV
jgi:hypothetical protein